MTVVLDKGIELPTRDRGFALGLQGRTDDGRNSSVVDTGLQRACCAWAARLE